MGIGHAVLPWLRKGALGLIAETTQVSLLLAVNNFFL